MKFADYKEGFDKLTAKWPGRDIVVENTELKDGDGDPVMALISEDKLSGYLGTKKWRVYKGTDEPIGVKKAAEPAPIDDSPKDAKKPIPLILESLPKIGPAIAKTLDAAGISTFEHLAGADVEKLKEILLKAGGRQAKIDPSTWPALAQNAIDQG